MNSRLIENLPPRTGDIAIDGALRTAYIDGALQAFTWVLDELQKEYMKPTVKPMSTEAEAILEVAKFLGGVVREQSGSLKKL